MNIVTATSVVKAIVFLGCSLAFVWKVIDGVTAYLSAQTGTNVRVDAIRDKGDVPLFAICRHPGQVNLRSDIDRRNLYMRFTHDIASWI